MQQGTRVSDGRLPNLDVLRGLAAMAVLVGHAYGLGGRKIPLAAENLTDGLLMLSPVGVWLFFAMSGLVIGAPFVRALVADTPRPPSRPYAVRRAARIYPLYLVCAAAVLVILGAGGMGPLATGVHLALLHNLLPDHQLAFINVTWTLTLEVLFYLAVPILAAMAERIRRGPVPPATLARWILATAAASVVWMLAAGLIAPDMARTSQFARMLLPSMWSAFCPGLLIAVLRAASPADIDSSGVLRLLDRVRSDATAAWAVGGAAAAVAFLAFFAQPGWGLRTYLWCYDLGRVSWSVAFGVLVLRAIGAPGLEARTPRPLVLLGTWSYGVYLIHGTVFTILMQHDEGSLIPLHRGGATAFLVHVVFLTAITVPLSWLSWRLIERPAMQRARNDRRPPRGAAVRRDEASEARRGAAR
jgi:peptidoglycan/LPS O-acetylase OafA/YrhL